MTRISGVLTDAGLAPLVGVGAYLRVTPEKLTTYPGSLITTKPLLVAINPTTAAFNFTVAASRLTRPQTLYRIEVGWLDPVAGFSPADYPDWLVRVPEGDLDFGDLEGIPANPSQTWVDTSPPDSPVYATGWADPVTGDYKEWA